jgi:hypothetical protein
MANVFVQQAGPKGSGNNHEVVVEVVEAQGGELAPGAPVSVSTKRHISSDASLVSAAARSRMT